MSDLPLTVVSLLLCEELSLVQSLLLSVISQVLPIGKTGPCFFVNEINIKLIIRLFHLYSVSVLKLINSVYKVLKLFL